MITWTNLSSSWKTFQIQSWIRSAPSQKLSYPRYHKRQDYRRPPSLSARSVLCFPFITRSIKVTGLQILYKTANTRFKTFSNMPFLEPSSTFQKIQKSLKLLKRHLYLNRIKSRYQRQKIHYLLQFYLNLSKNITLKESEGLQNSASNLRTKAAKVPSWDGELLEDKDHVFLKAIPRG